MYVVCKLCSDSLPERVRWVHLARLGLFRFRFRFYSISRKKKHCSAWSALKNSKFLDSVGDRVAKSGRKQSKQNKHKLLSWVYYVTNATNTVGIQVPSS